MHKNYIFIFNTFGFLLRQKIHHYSNKYTFVGMKNKNIFGRPSSSFIAVNTCSNTHFLSIGSYPKKKKNVNFSIYQQLLFITILNSSLTRKHYKK